MLWSKVCGALWVSKRAFNLCKEPIIWGGHQEEGLRAGTLNVPGIVGFSNSAKVMNENIEQNKNYIIELTDLFSKTFCSVFPSVKINGSLKDRLPGGLHYTVTGGDVRGVLASTPEIICSTGMACSTDEQDSIFTALNRLPESRYSLRIQIGFENTEDEILYAAETLASKFKKSLDFWGKI